MLAERHMDGDNADHGHASDRYNRTGRPRRLRRQHAWQQCALPAPHGRRAT